MYVSLSRPHKANWPDIGAIKHRSNQSHHSIRWRPGSVGPNKMLLTIIVRVGSVLGVSKGQLGSLDGVKRSPWVRVRPSGGQG